MSADPVDQISRICDDAEGDKLTRIAAIIGEAPTNEAWNLAIEAAEDVIAQTVQGVEMAPAVRAVRRLKR